MIRTNATGPRPYGVRRRIRTALGLVVSSVLIAATAPVMASAETPDPTDPTPPVPAELDDTATVEVPAEPTDRTPADDKRAESRDRTPADDKSAATSRAAAGTAARQNAAPAAAGDEPEPLTVTLRRTTGTAPFDDDDAPGHDSSADNDIVRTNDSITYVVGLRFEVQSQTNPVITFTLPRGEELVSLPPFCLESGSGVSPQSLPAPELPVTPTSWTSLPQQVVTCRVADQNAATSLDYSFSSQVRPEVPNGTVLGPVVASATSDQVETPVRSDSVRHTVSAVGQFDLSKIGDATNNNQGPLWSTTAVCPFDNDRTCFNRKYPLTISAPPGGKGISPLRSPITFEDDLRPESFFGEAIWEEAVNRFGGDETAAIEAYAPRLHECVSVSWETGGVLPYSFASAGNNTVTNAVRHSGSITCEQAAGAGAPVEITITDADTTAYTVPSTAGRGGSALAASSAYVVSFTISVWVPVDALVDLGASSGGATTLATHNEFTNISMTDINGNANQGEAVGNNQRNAMLEARTSFGFDKFFTGIFGQAGNTDPQSFAGISSYEGPPGSGKWRDGNTPVVDGQYVQSVLSFSERGVPGSDAPTSRVGCDVWDPEQFQLAANDSWRSNQTQYSSNGDPVWVARYILATSGSPGANAWNGNGIIQNLKVEYSSGAFGAGVGSDCSGGVWYASPDEVPGAASQTAADGTTTWTGVNRVRVSFQTDWSGYPDIYDLGISIGLKAQDNGSEVLGNWASHKSMAGLLDADELLGDQSGQYRLSDYDPQTHRGVPGDRLLMAEAVARVSKEVRNRSTGQFVGTGIPEYSTDQQVLYRLRPSLTTGSAVGTGVTAPLVVEDCLPRHLQFVSAERENGDPLPPADQSTSGAPGNAELACPAGSTFLRWNLGNVPINEPIDPILVTAEVLDTARTGLYTNTVLVSSPADPSPVESRQDSVQVRLDVPKGIQISKSTPQTLVEVNPEGVTDPRQLRWQVRFANIDYDQEVSDVDVVDVLPSDGLGDSSFTGTLEFDSATPIEGTDIAIWYTATASTELSSDPSDASNGSTGTTVWCDAASGGSVVSGDGTSADCPATAAEVTGLRFTRPGEFDPDDDFGVEIVMTPIGNAGGDVYSNIAGGRATGVSQPVGPVKRDIGIVASSIGDLVWDDANGNGIQDAGERLLPDWPVRLIGTDADGNAVDLSTRTKANGRYLFDGLASGEYKLDFSRDPLPDNASWTSRRQGDDPAVDSDVDPTTGETDTFTLGMDTDDLTWDAGVYFDRNIDISVNKKLVSVSEPTAANEVTVAYDIEVVNAGTAIGRYDLSDVLKFGDGITIGAVSVSNTGPGDIETNAGFDGVTDTEVVTGQRIGDDQTHTYRVEVDAVITTSSTSESRDCELTENEEGTGFLNEAVVTVDGVTTRDTACGDVDEPRVSDIGVDKRLVETTPTDRDGAASVTYELTVRNDGDGDGTYSLTDELQFGDSIEIEEVGVTTEVEGIEVNSGFDGVRDTTVVKDVPLGPGRSHVFTVTVLATVTTDATSSDLDCVVDEGEQGSGFLNEASLEAGGSSSTDTACATVDPPVVDSDEAEDGDETPGSLVHAGGPALWLALLGMLAVTVGAGVLRRRARNA